MKIKQLLVAAAVFGFTAAQAQTKEPKVLFIGFQNLVSIVFGIIDTGHFDMSALLLIQFASHLLGATI